LRLIEEIEMMTTLTIELPVDGLPSAAELPANFSDEARFLLAVKLFHRARRGGYVTWGASNSFWPPADPGCQSSI
jgi:hypothetical protein